jgi:hypothetical protein
VRASYRTAHLDAQGNSPGQEGQGFGSDAGHAGLGPGQGFSGIEGFTTPGPLRAGALRGSLLHGAPSPSPTAANPTPTFRASRLGNALRASFGNVLSPVREHRPLETVPEGATTEWADGALSAQGSDQEELQSPAPIVKLPENRLNQAHWLGKLEEQSHKKLGGKPQGNEQVSVRVVADQNLPEMLPPPSGKRAKEGGVDLAVMGDGAESKSRTSLAQQAWNERSPTSTPLRKLGSVRWALGSLFIFQIPVTATTESRQSVCDPYLAHIYITSPSCPDSCQFNMGWKSDLSSVYFQGLSAQPVLLIWLISRRLMRFIGHDDTI